MLKQTLAAAAFAILPTFASSYETLEICATYTNTGSAYKVRANVMKGSELNKLTKTYNYTSYNKYAVIFWADDQATVIELPSYCSFSSFGCDGKDQRGYPWKVKRGWNFCN